MKYGRGYFPDSPHWLKRKFDKLRSELLGAEEPVVLPKESSIAEYAPVLAQGQTQTCYAHAGASAIVMAFAAAGNPLGWVPSPLDLSRLTRSLERARSTPADEELPPLEDLGGRPFDMVTAMHKYGIRPMGNQVDGRFSDCSADNVNDEAMLDELLRDAASKLIGDYWIFSLGSDKAGLSADLALANYKKSPVCLAWHARDEDADWTDAKGPMTAREGAPNHYSTVTGYRTLASGAREFEILNPWGEEFGNFGFFWADEEFVAQTTDRLVMAVRFAS